VNKDDYLYTLFTYLITPPELNRTSSEYLLRSANCSSFPFISIVARCEWVLTILRSVSHSR